MTRKALIPMLAAVLATALVAAPASAQRNHDRDRHGQGNPFQQINPFQRGGDSASQWDKPREERAPQRDVPLSEVLRDLRGKYGGQHLDARKVGDYYMIAWMTSDGRKLNLRVNALTGREE